MENRLNPKMFEGLTLFAAYIRLIGALQQQGKVELPNTGMEAFTLVKGEQLALIEETLYGKTFPEIVEQLDWIIRNNKGHKIFSVREPKEENGRISLCFSVTVL